MVPGLSLDHYPNLLSITDLRNQTSPQIKKTVVFLHGVDDLLFASGDFP